MALLSLLKGKKTADMAPKPLIIKPASVERHIDDLELPSPSIPEEMIKEALPTPAVPSIPSMPSPAMPTFPEIPKEEAKPEIREKEAEVELPAPEVPEELPELEELSPEAKEEIKEFPPEIIQEIGVAEIKEKPVFISVESYKNVLETLRSMKSDLLRFSELPTRMADIKSSKDKVYEKFRNVLEDIERKLLYIDKNVFGGIK